jgi:hypothetical protein
VIKACWWCKYFEYRMGDDGYSEYTPGYNLAMECRKNHWTFDANMTSQSEFGENMQKAENCKDFKSIK